MNYLISFWYSKCIIRATAKFKMYVSRCTCISVFRKQRIVTIID